jgi:FKBP-type peptidyl-prolyl cis-trans isomerase
VTSRSTQSGRRTSGGDSRRLRATVALAAIVVAALATSACTGGYRNDPSATVLNSPASVAATAGSSYGSTDPTGTSRVDTSTGRPTRLEIKDLRIGKGKMAAAGKSVTIEYTGWLLANGKEFDSSKKAGHPLTFIIGMNQVILGVDNGVQGMKVGGERELIIPSAFGYGEQITGDIPAGSDLKFRVKLLSVK